MSDVVLDFETRSKLDLTKTGAIIYAQHPSTSIFCLGYKIGDGPCLLWIPERAPMPWGLWAALQRGGKIVAQNAGFERAILNFTLSRYPLITSKQRKFLKAMKPNQFRCTAAKAAMCNLPRSLEMANKALGLPTQKDIKGHKLIKKYCKPRKPSKKNPSLWWNDRQDLRDIYSYCLVDVKAEWELDQALPDLSPYEQSLWELDQKINERGVLIDIPTVKLILKMIHEETVNITRNVQRLSQDTIGKVTQTAKVLAWVNARGADMANLQAATIRDKLLDDSIDSKVSQMLHYRQGGSKSSTAKYLAMVKAVGDDNRARELLLYCGATPTARWAGKRIQIQNLPRVTVKDFNSDEAIKLIQTGGIEAIRKRYGATKVMPVLVSCIRGMLIASPGKELFCADFAAVEARLAFWIAEHHEGVQAFIEDRKLYEEMASQTFGIPIEEILKESLERFIGKESILGSQYGLGWLKFLKNCHQKGMPDVTPEIAKKAVYTYRKIHHPVPTFWRNIEHACVQATLNPGKRFKVTKVVAYVNGNFLNIKLPSGRRLRYFKPRISIKQLASGRLVPQIHYWTMDHHQWHEVVIWGGVLFNHIVQGTARDLMANGLINIENGGYDFLFSAHDEGVGERPIGKGNLKEYISLMTQLPEWAEGAPITASGFVAQRYRK